MENDRPRAAPSSGRLRGTRHSRAVVVAGARARWSARNGKSRGAAHRGHR